MVQQRQITELSIHHLQPNPLQPRGVVSADSLQDMVESIREHGILEPIVVAHTLAGYQIIAGERRWRAAKLAGLEMVPVIIKETSPRGMLEMAIVENVQRYDLNPIERAKAFERLMTEFSLGSGDVAKRVGKSISYVSNTMRLMTLPDAIKDGLISNLITEGHARALAGISDLKSMIEAYKIILKDNGSVRLAEELARRWREKEESNQVVRPAGEVPLILSDQIVAIEQNLHQALAKSSTKFRVKLTRSRAETKLIIALKGTPEETEATLQKIVSGINA